MRWLAAIFVLAIGAFIGAAGGVALFFSKNPQGANGLLGAMFALPALIVIGGLLGALAGVAPSVIVFRKASRAAERARVLEEPEPRRIDAPPARVP